MDTLDLGFKSLIFFILIFVRLMGVFVQAPLFGRPKGIPMAVQVGYGLAISFVMYSVLPMPKELPGTALELAITAAGQVMIGLILGYASFMVAAGIQFAGELLDVQLGLSIAATFDPSAGGPVNLIRQFEFRLAILIWIFIHGDYFFFRAIRRSYELIPSTSFSINGAVVNKLIEMTGGIFIIAMEMSAPVLVALFITQVALGLLNRAAQQFNVFMISFPINIMVGFGILILSLSTFLGVAMPNLYSNLNHDLATLILLLRHR